MSELLQIREPKKPSPPTQAVGIDLGTTHSLVATVAQGQPTCLVADEEDALLLPSVVHYSANGSVVVGKYAKQLASQFPEDTLSSVKRFMGKNRSDVDAMQLKTYRLAPGEGPLAFQVSGGPAVSPVEVSAEILRILKQRACAALSSKITQAVITVPAYFDNAQRQATQDAGKLAGLEVLRLLNEPTAAALAYGLQSKKQGCFVVFDLGGGTFDISILKLKEGIFEVKATAGDSALGGDDFDLSIAQALLQKWDIEVPTPFQKYVLLEAARQLKERLSHETKVEIRFEAHVAEITREDLRQWIAPFFKRIHFACKRALKDAGLAKEDIQAIVLVGGSTRMPCVQSWVEEIFGKPGLAEVDPEKVVAMGAAIQAQLLCGATKDSELLLLDVIPLSLGLETMGGMVEKLLLRNSTLPAKATQLFTTFQDGQSGMDIHVVQGEREMAKDCRSLAKFHLKGIPPMAAGLARVEVGFSVDANGLLSVEAHELATGIQQRVVVQPSHGLSEEDIEQMLKASIRHAQEDIFSRLLAEQQMEAKRMLAELSKQMGEHSECLSVEEASALSEAAKQLETLLETTQEAAKLRNAILALDNQAKNFTERIMNSSINSVLQGHSMSEF
ncbi:MAG: Fe-S protein assembly chaperone HscA [Proteobacteria bacterium]|nr:Fe-S protein assembly chaperone HscA [Cystobacterineae bacterium]MCL2259553.1 Fe-S protein assembly chaperone HscA [Cystobacterineae bacterium]MCL2313963.1 Fe-S protein assembly chaperone HscA [Pseudomonadota bacterium]